jgi:hypothetical protein
MFAAIRRCKLFDNAGREANLLREDVEAFSADHIQAEREAKRASVKAGERGAERSLDS